MIHPQRMHSKDNHEISPEEKVSLSTLVKMSKMLKLERGDHHYYPPQRLVIQGFTSNVLLSSSVYKSFSYEINAPIKFVQQLHPTRTMVQVEYCNIQNDNISSQIASNGSFRVELPDIPAQHQWLDLYDHVYPTDIGDNSDSVQPQSSSVIFCGSSSSSYLGNQFVNSQGAGFPITDTHYLNNNKIRIRVVFEPSISNSAEDPSLLSTDMTLVFYTYSGYED